MQQDRIARINELAKKAKTVGLTPEEHAEQSMLRNAYLADIRLQLEAQLDNTYLVDEKGNKTKLKRKKK